MKWMTILVNVEFHSHFHQLWNLLFQNSHMCIWSCVIYQRKWYHIEASGLALKLHFYEIWLTSFIAFVKFHLHQVYSKLLELSILKYFFRVGIISLIIYDLRLTIVNVTIFQCCSNHRTLTFTMKNVLLLLSDKLL